MSDRNHLCTCCVPPRDILDCLLDIQPFEQPDD